MADSNNQSNNTASTGGDDDSGNQSTYYENDGTSSSSVAQSQTYYENDGTATTSTVSQVTQNAGTTPAGKAGASSATPKPGKRLQNPLGNYSSYTYQISLYMVTPEVYNDFVNSGRKNINKFNQASAQAMTNAGGVFLVAQSGGINNTTQQRAPGFNLDYYIDNLVIESAATGKETGGAFNATEIRFTITEPYGFSFVTNLKTAMDQLQQYSTLQGYKSLVTATRNFFVLGVRFLGYDKNGELLTGSDGTTDPAFQRYYDIFLKEVKFKIDGRAVTYNCSAQVIQTLGGFGIKYGRTKNDITAVGSTVESILKGEGDPNSGSTYASGLLTQLNYQQKDLEKSGQIKRANQYDVVFISDGGEVIANSSIINLAADADKTKQPVSLATKSNQVNEGTATSASPQNRVTTMVFKADTPILQCIQLAVKQSSYIQDALKAFYTSEATPNQKTDTPDTVTGKNRTLKYYNVSANLNVLEYDTILNDWAYSITYVVEPYETPVIQAVGANGTTPYYGPVKRYDYWYTGKNSEIIRYEQSYDNTYMIAMAGALGVNGNGTPASGDNVTPTTPNLRSNSPRQNTLGYQGEVENGITTFLTDPESLSEADITILGDPDFLMYPNASDLLTQEYDPFYDTNGYTIKSTGGQVFIEIDFKEAIDYDTNKGIMSLNDKILFFKYPPNIQAIAKGIIYLVTSVHSEFKGGKFEQKLHLQLYPFGANASDTTNAFAASGREQQNTTPTNNRIPTDGSGNVATGFKNEPPVSTTPTDNVAPNDPTIYDYNYGNTPNQQTSPTGGLASVTNSPASITGVSVADDDAAAQAATFNNAGSNGYSEADMRSESSI